MRHCEPPQLGLREFLFLRDQSDLDQFTPPETADEGAGEEGGGEEGGAGEADAVGTDSPLTQAGATPGTE